MPPVRLTLNEVAQQIRAVRCRVPAQRAALIAICGIDGSGKGYVTRQLLGKLEQPEPRHPQQLQPRAAPKVVVVNVDAWLNLPHVRFSTSDAGRHFYCNALRLDEMFSELVIPLREHRSVDREVNAATETATSFQRMRHFYSDVDIILVEGIFLLQRRFQALYDFSLWIECTFETALRRAIDRAQEGLPPAETIAAFRQIYFPAQEIHLAQDDPVHAASALYVNDSRWQA